MTEPVYKLAHVDKAEIALASRKGLMVADSHLSKVTGLKLPTR